MVNIIAKKISITLDTKKVVPLNIRDFTPTIGDSIEITAKIIEDGLPKDITGTTARLIGVKSNGEYFEQTKDITILDSINGTLKIKPSLSVFDVEGRTLCGLILEDEDEAINIQRFLLTVNNTIEKEIIQTAEREIQTLKRLNELLDKYQSDIAIFTENINGIRNTVIELKSNVDSTILSVNGKVDNLVIETTNKINTTISTANLKVDTDLKAMNSTIETQILNTNNKFNELNVAIDEEFNSIEDRLNNVNNTINTQLSKITKLVPIDLATTNYMYFATDIIKESAENLLKKSYMLHISGMLDASTYNSSNVIVNFFKQNGKVYINTVVISDRVVNSRSISPSVIFDNFTNEILPTTTGFRILVRSNITKALNTENTTRCCLTPLTI